MLLGDGGQVAGAEGSQVVRPLRGDRSTAPVGPDDRLTMARRPPVGGLFEALIDAGMTMIGALCWLRDW